MRGRWGGREEVDIEGLGLWYHGCIREENGSSMYSMVDVSVFGDQARKGREVEEHVRQAFSKTVKDLTAT